jgi:hypothetical protein
MLNKEFDISIHTWLSGNGENYKVLRISRFGKQYSIWVQNYLLNDNPSSAYDAYYIEDGDATLHEIFTSREEAMEVADYIVGHYKMERIEQSMGVINQ